MALENYRPIQFPEKTELDSTDVVLIDSATNGTNKYQLNRIAAQAAGQIAAAVEAEEAARQAADSALDGKIGTLSNLTTTAKGSAVAAINEVDANADAAQSAADANAGKIGTLSSLTTDAKTDLVSAVNEVDEAVTDVKSDLTQNTETVFCILANPADGYIPFSANNGDSITIKTKSGEVFGGSITVGFYDERKAGIASIIVTASNGSQRTLSISLSKSASYMRLLVADWSGEDLIIINNSNLTCTEVKSFSQDINSKVNYSLYSTIDQSNNFTNTKYIVLNGGIGNIVDMTPVDSAQRGYVVLPCKKGDSFVLTATGANAPRAWGFTDTTYKLLSVANNGAVATDLLLTAENDGYFICNHSNTQPYALTAIQLFKALSETEILSLIGELNAPIVVDGSGNGDYTSFTLACKETHDSGKDIVVKAGTYDIVAEYVAIWGQSAVDSMADADSATFDGWQYGVKMNGRKFTFEPGAKLVCDWTGHTVDGTHRFSALRVEMNAEIVGLDLDCTNTFYCIHDDYGNSQTAYTNVYKNCKVIGHNISNVNCIGGGCKKYSRHIIDNCYFDNNTTASTVVRYHNTNADGAVPEIYVSNSFFGTYFRANYYGTQTSKMRVYVNNCYAKRIYKDAEGSSSTVDNVELYKWCNEETDPET